MGRDGLEVAAVSIENGRSWFGDRDDQPAVLCAGDLGGSSIVCLGGLSKPPRTAANPRDYREIKRYGAEFQKRRTVLE